MTVPVLIMLVVREWKSAFQSCATQWTAVISIDMNMSLYPARRQGGNWRPANGITVRRLSGRYVRRLDDSVGRAGTKRMPAIARATEKLFLRETLLYRTSRRK
jgi:hypothetical protein